MPLVIRDPQRRVAELGIRKDSETTGAGRWILETCVSECLVLRSEPSLFAFDIVPSFILCDFMFPSEAATISDHQVCSEPEKVS